MRVCTIFSASVITRQIGLPKRCASSSARLSLIRSWLKRISTWRTPVNSLHQASAAHEEYATACKLDDKFCKFVPAVANWKTLTNRNFLPPRSAIAAASARSRSASPAVLTARRRRPGTMRLGRFGLKFGRNHQVGHRGCRVFRKSQGASQKQMRAVVVRPELNNLFVFLNRVGQAVRSRIRSGQREVRFRPIWRPG